jgi:putative endonuclease
MAAGSRFTEQDGRQRHATTARPRSAVNAAGAAAERRVRRHFLLRGYRVLASNVRAGGNELDIVLRRGRHLVFAEVKMRRAGGYGDPLEAVGPEKARRVRRAAEAFLARHPELSALEIRFEAVAVRPGGIERVPMLV